MTNPPVQFSACGFWSPRRTLPPHFSIWGFLSPGISSSLAFSKEETQGGPTKANPGQPAPPRPRANSIHPIASDPTRPNQIPSNPIPPTPIPSHPSQANPVRLIQTTPHPPPQPNPPDPTQPHPTPTTRNIPKRNDTASPSVHRVQSQLVMDGVIGHLVRLLKHSGVEGADESSEQQLTELKRCCARTLRALSFLKDDLKGKILEEGGISALSALIDTGKPAICREALAALRTLSFSKFSGDL